MGWVAAHRRLVTTLFAVLLVAACTSERGQTSATPLSGSGHVIHVNLFVPLASGAAFGSACDATALSATGPKAATIPGSRLRFLSLNRANRTSETIGDQPVPRTGTVAKPISDDPSFPTACLFSFDVPTAADVDGYAFALESIYFPMPIIPRAQLEAAGWVANIGVNPQ